MERAALDRCAVGLAWLSALMMAAGAAAQVTGGVSGLRAEVRLRSTHVQNGHPVWAQFVIENTTDEDVTLAVPGTEPALAGTAMGLPLTHVFSAAGAEALAIESEAGRHWSRPIRYRMPKEAPVVTIAPHGSIGARVDLTEYFPALRGSGVYRIQWLPYAGALQSPTVVLEVAPRKQAEIVTDHGKLTLRFFYDEAPEHVQNFIELAERSFYDNLLFHRLEPGYMLMGGCPRGDGTGIRPDGKRVPAELNDLPHRKGTVSMALLDGDPDSASCQFFICYTRQKQWDHRYTVFAELVGDDSMATLDALMALPVDEIGRPLEPIHIRTIRVLNAPAEPADLTP